MIVVKEAPNVIYPKEMKIMWGSSRPCIKRQDLYIRGPALLFL